MGIVLALVSSALWGIADFAGGTASRRLPPVLVVLASQFAGLVAVAVAATATGEWSADIGYLPWAVAAGLVGAAGLLAFYRALAAGTMGVVSPIAALGVVVPVAAGLATGHLPHAIVGVGLVLAVAGVVGASGPEKAQGRSLQPVVLAVIAALCFGTTLLAIARGSVYSPLMTMVGMRASSVPVLAVMYTVLRYRRRAVPVPGAPRDDAVPGAAGTDTHRTDPHGTDVHRTDVYGTDTHRADVHGAAAAVWAVVVIAGLMDVSANLTFGFASTAGALTIVSILGSLYPAVTVLLARLIHGELLTRMQQGGVVVALAGVALITGWS